MSVGTVAWMLSTQAEIMATAVGDVAVVVVAIAKTVRCIMGAIVIVSCRMAMRMRYRVVVVVIMIVDINGIIGIIAVVADVAATGGRVVVGVGCWCASVAAVF